MRRFLDSAIVATKVVEYRRDETVFSQGDAGHSVMFIRSGGVKLSVVSQSGREAVVAVLGPADFFGEGCLAGQHIRIGSATAITPATVVVIAKAHMVRLLQEEHALSDRFIEHMLTRNLRIQQKLMEQSFNFSEKRVARELLVLSSYGKRTKPRQVVPKISHETLSKIVGITQSRVNLFMDKFKTLGFIEYDRNSPARIQVNSSLLSVVLND